MVNLKNIVPKYFLLLLFIHIQGSHLSKSNFQGISFSYYKSMIPPKNYELVQASSWNLLYQNLKPSKDLIKFKKIKRNLNAEACLIENCEICNSNQRSCKECKKNFKVRDNKCISTESEESSGNKNMKIIIIMAFISVPLILIVFCCFIYLFFRRKTSDNINRRRIFSESIITEANALRSRDSQLSRLNRESSSGDAYINSVSNLMITSENFSIRFPIFEFIPELISENCSICFEQFNDTSILRKTPCHHIFHHDCLFEWLITNDQKRCPNDNTKLS